jgi:hypothetical protein
MGIIKKLWNDSVWSKVIATIIAPYVIALLAAVKGFFDENGYLTSLKEILGYVVGVPVWLIPIIIVAVSYLTWLVIKHREKNDMERSVIRHQGPYITFKDRPQDQCYCAVCWDTKHEKVQLPHYYGDTFKCPKCGSDGCYDY